MVCYNGRIIWWLDNLMVWWYVMVVGWFDGLIVCYGMIWCQCHVNSVINIVLFQDKTKRRQWCWFGDAVIEQWFNFNVKTEIKRWTGWLLASTHLGVAGVIQLLKKWIFSDKQHPSLLKYNDIVFLDFRCRGELPGMFNNNIGWNLY